MDFRNNNMSGHSKWAQIKRQKGVADAKRGNLFTKLVREIMAAVKQGGSNPEGNFRLRLAIQKAKDSNMPLDNIKRAIEKGAGKESGVAPSEMTLEGYGPGGIAILVRALTDNKNRMVQEVRNIFSRNGGSLSESGGVSWLFQPRGVITVDAFGKNEEDLALLTIDCGADDVNIEKGFIEAYTEASRLEALRRSLESRGVKIISAEPSLVPISTTQVGEKLAQQNLKLLDMLEELEDIQGVYTNLDYSEEVMEALKAHA